MSDQNYGGIDPGVEGAAAVIAVDADGNCRVKWCTPNPYYVKTVKIERGKRRSTTRKAPGKINIDDMVCMIHHCGAWSLDVCSLVAVEDVHGRGGWGAKQQERMGESKSSWLALLRTFVGDDFIVEITPQAWHKLVSPTRTGRYGGKWTKSTSVALCKRLYPDANLRRTPKSRTDDHNMAEAILIAHAAYLLGVQRRRDAELERRTTDV